MSGREIIFENVSKFYGEVLGVNRVNLAIPPGITGLVGPNGSGKTTLMNLMTGLLRPTQGTIQVLDVAPDQPERLFRVHGLLHAVRFVSARDDGLPVRLFLPVAARQNRTRRRSAWPGRRSSG